MQLAFGQLLLFDAGFNALAKQGAARRHQRGVVTGLEDLLDRHQKQICRFFGSHVGGKALLDASLFHAAKKRLWEVFMSVLVRWRLSTGHKQLLIT